MVHPPASICPYPKKLSSLSRSFSSTMTVKRRAVTIRCCKHKLQFIFHHVPGLPGRLTLKSSVSISLLGTFTALTWRAGPLSLTLLSLEQGVTHTITGWVVPSSWLST